MGPRWDYSLSASKLGIECDRCFYLHAHPTYGIERPRGLYPSLPGGLDLALKRHVDEIRPELPDWLQGRLPGRLWGTAAEIARWRSWQSAPKAVLTTPHATVRLIAAFDDLLEECPGMAPLDWKTRGSAPKEETAAYYQRQMDIYALILERHGYPLSGHGYIALLWPAGPVENGLSDRVVPSIPFELGVLELEVSPDRAVALIERATALLAGPLPPPDEQCEYCAYVSRRLAHEPPVAERTP